MSLCAPLWRTKMYIVQGAIILKGQCHEIFGLRFFTWISSPKLRLHHYGRFKFLQKFAEIFPVQGAPPMSLTPVANEKKINQKIFLFFFWTPLGSRVSIYIHFFLQVHFKLSAQFDLIACHRCRLHWWQICCQCRWYQWQFATSFVYTAKMRRRACMPRQQSTSEDDSSCHSLDDPDRCLLALKTEIRLDGSQSQNRFSLRP